MVSPVAIPPTQQIVENHFGCFGGDDYRGMGKELAERFQTQGDREEISDFFKPGGVFNRSIGDPDHSRRQETATSFMQALSDAHVAQLANDPSAKRALSDALTAGGRDVGAPRSLAPDALGVTSRAELGRLNALGRSQPSDGYSTTHATEVPWHMFTGQRAF
jgi:hypothetical protein